MYMAGKNLKLASMRELLELERATHIICAKYENLNKMDNFLSKELYDKFSVSKARYDAVISEIEKRVETLVDE